MPHTTSTEDGEGRGLLDCPAFSVLSTAVSGTFFVFRSSPGLVYHFSFPFGLAKGETGREARAEERPDPTRRGVELQTASESRRHGLWRRRRMADAEQGSRR